MSSKKGKPEKSETKSKSRRRASDSISNKQLENELSELESSPRVPDEIKEAIRKLPPEEQKRLLVQLSVTSIRTVHDSVFIPPQILELYP